MARSATLRTQSVSTAAASSYATASISPTANRILLIGVVSRSTLPSDAPVTPTLSGLSGVTYTQRSTEVQTAISNDGRLTVFTAPTGASPGSGAITADFAGNSQIGCSIIVIETDNHLTTPFVQAKTGPDTGNVTSRSITFDTTPVSTSTVFGFFYHNEQETHTPGTGLTELSDANFASPTTTASALWDSDSAPSTLDASWTTSTRGIGIIIELALTSTGQTLNPALISLATTVTSPAALHQGVKPAVIPLTSTVTSPSTFHQGVKPAVLPLATTVTSPAAFHQQVKPAVIPLVGTVTSPTALHQQFAVTLIPLTVTANSPIMTSLLSVAAIALATTLNNPAFHLVVAPALIPLAVTPNAPRVDQAVSPALVPFTVTPNAVVLGVGISVTRISLTVTPNAPAFHLGVAPALISLATTLNNPTLAQLQTVSPALLPLTLTLNGVVVGSFVTYAPPGLTGAVEYVVELFDSGGTFGPNTKLGEIWDARNVGWSRYDRLPGKGFLTLYQDSPHLQKFSPLITHVRITRVSPTGDTELYNGQFVDYDTTGDDVVMEFFDYLALFAISRSGYRVLYPEKLLGTEIAKVETELAIASTFSPIGFLTSGTWENPLGTDGVTAIKTNKDFGLMDQMRLQLLYDLTEFGRANTVNHVTFEVTRTAPFTFNFWKDKGSDLNMGLILNGNVSDYRYLPNWKKYRNDLATLGTTVGGGATEIIKTNEAAAAIRGRRQDVATIKTILGITTSTVEADQQHGATARMLQVAVQKPPVLLVDLERGTLAPFDGWDICDTVIPEFVNGFDNITARQRIVGARGLFTEAGEDLGLIVEPVIT